MCTLAGALALLVSAGEARAQTTPEVSVSFEGTTPEYYYGHRWEGVTLNFKITASPQPTADLTVKLTIFQSGSGGDFVVPADLGSKTVTVSANTDSVPVQVRTEDDEVVERRRNVGVRVETGTGYTPHATQNALTTQVWDDDTPRMSITGGGTSITGGGTIVEGGVATFTVSLSPAPANPLPVEVLVAQGNDFVADADLGSKTVTVPTSGSVTYTVQTVDDAVDEPMGYVRLLPDYLAWLRNPSAGYGPDQDNHSGYVWVRDNDDPPANTPVVSITGGGSIVEGETATFTVSASPPPQADLEVTVRGIRLRRLSGRSHRRREDGDGADLRLGDLRGAHSGRRRGRDWRQSGDAGAWRGWATACTTSSPLRP